MKVGREFGAEVEEQRIALERLALREENTLQLSVWFIALERNDRVGSYCDIKRV